MRDNIFIVITVCPKEIFSSNKLMMGHFGLTIMLVFDLGQFD